MPNQPKKTITLDPAVVRFFQERAAIFEKDGETIYEINIKLSHLELNEFELIEKSPVRYFFISYNGMCPTDDKAVIGHLAFTSNGYPSLLFITEILVPKQSTIKITNVVIMQLKEFDTEQDFNDFTIGYDAINQLDNFLKN